MAYAICLSLSTYFEYLTDSSWNMVIDYGQKSKYNNGKLVTEN